MKKHIFSLTLFVCMLFAFLQLAATMPANTVVAQGSCTYSISPTSATFPASGGTGSVTVTAPNGCALTYRSNVSWVTVTGVTTIAGGGIVNYTVAQNTGAARTGTLTIVGQTFSVQQAGGDGGSCSYSIDPIGRSHPANGGGGDLHVYAPNSCSWSAVSNNSWIHVIAGASGFASDVVEYRVDANDNIPNSPARTGTLTIADKTFTVTQAGTACEFSLTPTTQTFNRSGRQGSFQVQVSDACQWDAIVQRGKSDTTTPLFITITSSTGTRTGNGEVIFSVAENLSDSARTNYIWVRDHYAPDSHVIFRVVQGARSDCTYSFSPASRSHSKYGIGFDTAFFTVSTQHGCPINPIVNVDWIHVPSDGTTIADDSVGYQVDANHGSFRTGTISVGNNSFVVYQDPVDCPMGLTCHYYPNDCSDKKGSREESMLSVSRSFRDEVLAKTSRGQEYTRLYYHFAREAVQILTHNPLLILRSSQMMLKYKPMLELIVKGESVTFTPDDVEEIDLFLKDVSSGGSPELREAVNGLCEDLRNPQVLSEFHITMVAGEKQRSSAANPSANRICGKAVLGLLMLFGYCAFSFFGLNQQRRRRVMKNVKLLLVIALSLAVANIAPFAPTNAAPVKTSRQKQQPSPLANLPLTFEPNVGQSNTDAQFIARGNGYALSLKATEAEFTLHRQTAANKKQLPEAPHPGADKMRMKLCGASASATVEGLEALPSTSNYLRGADAKTWREGVANYAKIKCADVYRGIDVIYYGKQSQLEYDFKLAPGADSKAITLQFEGAEAIRVDSSGDLQLHTANGDLRWSKPVAFQEVNGKRKEVACNYILQPSNAAPRVGFAVGDYDPSLPLTIDPALIYSTYFGAGGTDEGTAMTIDAAGNLYVVGFTSSTDLPTANPLQPIAGGGQQDAFVAKLNPSGTALLYATYIGGNQQDNASSIAVDAAGNAYITGFTTSTNFPVKDALQTANKGVANAFVVKLNAAGALLSSTLLGGGGNDSGTGIALDAAGNIYVSGITTSPNFPLQNATQASLNGPANLFISKLNATGNQLLFSTYLGGTGSDAVMGMVIDTTGNLYVTGVTTSRDLRTVNALQRSHGGGFFDGFVAKLNTTTHELVYLTYLGGTGEDRCFRIAVDASGNAYVAGDTDSRNLPLANALQNAIGGSSDAFVVKLSPAGALVYATYLGGSDIDGATAVAVNPQGEAYVTGFTASRNFPLANQLQNDNAGSFDAFIVKLSAAGSKLDFATYLGGSGLDTGFSIAVDAAGNAYVMGQTVSQNFPAINPLQRNFGGVADLFIAKINIGSQGGGLQVNGATIAGKKLTVFGSGFSNGAKILLNGEPQKTANDEQNPTGMLVAAKAGKKIARGETAMIQVRNPDGSLSNQLRFTR